MTFKSNYVNISSSGLNICSQVAMKMSDLGFTQNQGYNVTEGFTGKFIGVLRPNDLIKAVVNPSGVWFGIAYFAS